MIPDLAILDISASAYDEIAELLRAVHFDHVFMSAQRPTPEGSVEGKAIINMTGLALASRPRHIAELEKGQETAPIPMILFCPQCGEQHIDAPEPGTDWDNPPHRSHTCHTCKTIFRPCDRFTTGVAAIETHGTKDTAFIPLAPELRKWAEAKVIIKQIVTEDGAEISEGDALAALAAKLEEVMAGQRRSGN